MFSLIYHLIITTFFFSEVRHHMCPPSPRHSNIYPPIHTCVRNPKWNMYAQKNLSSAGINGLTSRDLPYIPQNPCLLWPPSSTPCQATIHRLLLPQHHDPNLTLYPIKLIPFNALLLESPRRLIFTF